MKHPRFGYSYTIPIRKELRAKATRSETILWEELRSRKFAGFKFRRQSGIGPYVVDFCSRRNRVVIEIDGEIHDQKEQSQWDKGRQRELETLGYRFIRYRSGEIENNLNSVLIDLLEKLADLSSPPSPETRRGVGGEVK